MKNSKVVSFLSPFKVGQAGNLRTLPRTSYEINCHCCVHHVLLRNYCPSALRTAVKWRSDSIRFLPHCLPSTCLVVGLTVTVVSNKKHWRGAKCVRPSYTFRQTVNHLVSVFQFRGHFPTSKKYDTNYPWDCGT